MSAASTVSIRLSLAGRRLLRHPADPGTARHVDDAVVRVQLAGDQPQQRRLAEPLRPTSPTLWPAGMTARGLVEDQAALDAVGEIVDVQHGLK